MERRRLADKVAIGAMPFNTSLDGWATSRRRSILASPLRFATQAA
ncbi:hypothetical protein [Kingella oralis]|nr:hypothetical protein [Kingella oralis]